MSLSPSIKPFHFLLGHSPTNHTNTVTTIRVRGHVVYTASRDATVRVWSSLDSSPSLIDSVSNPLSVVSQSGISVGGNGEKRERGKVLSGHTSWVTCIELMEEGQVLSGSMDRRVKIWAAMSGKCTATFLGHMDAVQAVGMGKKSANTFYSCGLSNELFEWNKEKVDAPIVKLTSSVEEDCGSFYSLVAQDSFICTGSSDNLIRVWDPRNSGKQLVQTLKKHGDIVRCLHFEPDELFSFISGVTLQQI